MPAVPQGGGPERTKLCGEGRCARRATQLIPAAELTHLTTGQYGKRQFTALAADPG